MLDALWLKAPPARSVDIRKTCSATSPEDIRRSSIGGRPSPLEALAPTGGVASESPSLPSTRDAGWTRFSELSFSSTCSSAGHCLALTLRQGRPLHSGCPCNHPVSTLSPEECWHCSKVEGKPPGNAAVATWDTSSRTAAATESAACRPPDPPAAVIVAVVGRRTRR